MIGKLKPYPDYTQSELPWLGEVPAHWTVQRLKTRVTNIVEQTDTMSDNEIYLALEHVESWTGRSRPQHEKAFSGQVKRFAANDVLFGKLRPYLAKVTRPIAHGVCAGEFFVLRPKDSAISTAYLELLLRAKPVIDVIDSSTFGAKMPRADWQFVGNLIICAPPLDEQGAIVHFLNWAAGRLDRAIRAKQTLIGLLNEQKQAIIHRVVTRGLDAYVPSKSSGIPRLGDIPQHWQIQRAKYLFQEVDERSETGTEELLSVSHITGVTPRSAKNITMFKAESYVGHKLCRPGDLVVNTMWAWMAALGVSKYMGIVSPSYAVYRPICPAKLLDEYADLLLRTPAYVSEYICRSTGIRSSRLRLYPEEFLQIGILLPPLEEQERIIGQILQDTASLNATIARVDREIALLREYRTRLIADVVTGTLDVRGVQIPVDEMAESVEPEPTELDSEEEEVIEEYADAD